MIMRLFSSLPTTLLAATAAALLSAGAQAGPMPTNVAAMKSMVDESTTEVRYRGGYRGGRLAYRGRLGYRGLGYGVAAGAIVAGAVARGAYYGGAGVVAGAAVGVAVGAAAASTAYYPAPYYTAPTYCGYYGYPPC